MKLAFEMVGMRHRGSESLVAGMAKGEQLRAVRDPRNSHDPNAVMIYHRDHFIAFVKATEARGLAQMMDGSRMPELHGNFDHIGSLPHFTVDDQVFK